MTAVPQKGMWSAELHKWVALATQHKIPILLPGTPI